MAGNKPTIKTKSKDERSKIERSDSENYIPKAPDRSRSIDPDLTVLRRPIDTSITGFYEVVRVFESGSDELRSLLGKECDVIYECKVCRSLFRSLANFISHKRVYCIQTFNSKIHAHFINSKFVDTNVETILQKERDYQNYWKHRKSITKIDESNIENEPVVPPITNDLTTIVERLTENPEITQSTNDDDDVQFCFEEIPLTKVAMFRNITSNNNTEDTIKAQVTELNKLQSRNSAVLNSDGKFTIKDLSNCPVIQISDDDDDEKDNNQLECKKCSITFSTQKTLKFHMKRHYESRIVYPCTDCSDLFSTSWSVYRHLYKVHRKTSAQIKRLRESIQNKTFRMDRPPIYYKKKKALEKAANDLINDAEKKDRENKAWVDNMESDGIVTRCGGCGRSFERRAALAAHSHICQRRTMKLLRRQQSLTNISSTAATDTAAKPVDDKLTHKDLNTDDNLSSEFKQEDKPEENVVVNATDKSNSQTSQNASDQSSSCGAQDIVDKTIVETLKHSDKYIAKDLVKSGIIESENLEALNQKMVKDVHIKHKICKKCNTGYAVMADIERHMAKHYGWNRFICKICDFRSYDRTDCVDHVISHHNMNGDDDFYQSVIRPLTSTEALDGKIDIKSEEPTKKHQESQSDTTSTISSSATDSKSTSVSRSTSDDDSSASSPKVETLNKKRIRTSDSMKPMKKLCTMEDDKTYNSDDDSLDESKSGSNNYIDDKKPKTDLETVMQVIFGDENRTTTAISNFSNSLACSRPTRNRTRPVREDFEYDLSNITKTKIDHHKEAPAAQSKPKRKQLLQNRAIVESTSPPTHVENRIEEIIGTGAPPGNHIERSIELASAREDDVNSIQGAFGKLPSVMSLPKLTPAPFKKAITASAHSALPMQPMPTLKRMPLIISSEKASSGPISTAIVSEAAAGVRKNVLLDNIPNVSEEILSSGEMFSLANPKLHTEVTYDNILEKKIELSSFIKKDEAKAIDSKNILITKPDVQGRKILIIKAPIRPVPASSLTHLMNPEKSPAVSGNDLASTGNIPDKIKTQIGTLKPVKLVNLVNLKPTESNISTDEAGANDETPSSLTDNVKDEPPMVLTTNEKFDLFDDLYLSDDATNEDSNSLLRSSDINKIAKLIPSCSFSK